MNDGSARHWRLPPSRNPSLHTLRITLAADGALTHLERVIGLLRQRGCPVTSVEARLEPEGAVAVIAGTCLHDQDPETLVARRLRRLIGVLAVEVIADPESEDTSIPSPLRASSY